MPGETRPNRQRNRLLNALANADLALLQPHLQRTPLKFRQQLQTANRRIRTVYFPEAGIASVVAIGGGGERRQAEVALVGREGMTGVPILHGVDRGPCDVFIQAEGEGQSISADALCEAVRQSNSLAECLLRFAHVFSVQSAYTALANAQGKIEERLARWLLMAQDRIEADELGITHEFLALMLGVRRAGVTTALQQLEKKGLVATARGAVTVKDRVGLQECANGLYGTPEAEFERLFR
jgi:CRP-like cAMP-binding protein